MSFSCLWEDTHKLIFLADVLFLEEMMISVLYILQKKVKVITFSSHVTQGSCRLHIQLFYIVDIHVEKKAQALSWLG
jgi:hypothetical protein